MSPLSPLIPVNSAVLVLVKSESHSLAGDCGPDHIQVNLPSPLTVHVRVRFEVTSSDDRNKGSTGTNTGAPDGVIARIHNDCSP